ncbi:hypothetical protein H2198_000987 [Neophaeococcomyces mojaviensis]|uniref:Uncharacterized protein n=1 Tax=Neophaeococcomyces mojaviensis TaxID=3383035 RepID=A0ACC3AJ07_9EURO|nr:hypothetical protein H2198_000987 [Knufia sp. JES_112]
MGDRYAGRSPPRRGPPRDRRDRDDHPDVEYFGAGESYRPGGGTGDGPFRPNRERDKGDRGDTWSADRRERDDRRRDDIDSYIPPTSVRAQRNRSRSPPAYRRRSRSPPPRGRTELFPDRARSPPRRYSPPRNGRPRSPIRRRSRSPYGARARSPDTKRPRDFSPGPRRSPKRERLDSPPRNRYDRPLSPPRRPLSPPRAAYRSRSRTPPKRDDRRPNYADETWRRRSSSPRPSGPGSTNTSRRSSPPVRPDRASLPGSAHSPAPYRERDRPYDTYTSRPRSPRNERDYQDRSRDPSLSQARDRDRDDYPPTGLAPPTGPKSAGGDYTDRPPPSGPSRGPSYNPQASPPTGPSSTFSAPTRPRGGGTRYDNPPPSRDFTSPSAALRGRTSLTYRAPGYRPPTYSAPHSSLEHIPIAPSAPVNNSPAPPSGPRGSATPSRGAYPSGPSRSSSTTYQSNADFPYRTNSNNSTSTTYPRSQRFNTIPTTPTPTGPAALTTTFTANGTSTASPASATPLSANLKGNVAQAHLATLERIVPGGRRTPGLTSGMNPTQEAKMKQLEDDAERIRADIVEKQKSKRETLREWDVRERESSIAALKSDLAEESLRTLEQGDEDNGALNEAIF